MISSPNLARYIEFLEEAARYFERRPTHGEDRSHWANVYNAENCRQIAEYIKATTTQIAEQGDSYD